MPYIIKNREESNIDDIPFIKEGIGMGKKNSLSYLILGSVEGMLIKFNFF